MSLRVVIIGFVCLNFAFAKAQPPTTTLPIKKDTVVTPEYFFIDGDSVSAIELDQVMLLQSLKFDSKYENVKYQILKRKVKKVWPYAKLAAERLTVLNERLAQLEYENDKKRYTKAVQKYLEEELTADLKKFSTTDGNILIKLIHRQTGITAFELMKNLRSGWSAFWVNNTAKVFDLDLKAKFDPENVIQDFYVEDILINEFKNEGLEEQESAIKFDYFKGRANWNAYEDALPESYDSINLADRAQRIKEYRDKKAKEREKQKRKLERKKRRQKR